MRRAVVIALLLAAIVVVVWHHRAPRAATPSVARPPSPPPTVPHRPPALDLTAAPPSLPGQAVPSEIETRLAAAHDALLTAVDPCWDDPGPPVTPAGSPDATVQRLRIRYRLVLENGQAHADDISPLDSSISDPRMDRCLLDRIRAARWVSTGPDVSLSISDVVILGDLAMRRRPTRPM